MLRRAQAGEAAALDALFRHELPHLRSWARLRVPRRLWGRADVDDFVQSTFLRALRRYRDFTIRDSARFQHYLRRILVNLVRDELRVVARLPEHSDLIDVAAHASPSAVDLLLGREARRRYRRAVENLPPRMRLAVTARLEHGLTYERIADLLGAGNAGIARAVVARGVTRLAADMRRHRRPIRRPPIRRRAGR